MNTHDKIELPPLPGGHYAPQVSGRYFYDDEMETYARAAIEADRKRRGEDQQPFGYFRPEPFGWTDCAATDEGAIALYERPQVRGEPVAWRYLTPTGWHATTDAARALGVAEHHTVEPLFAAPQPAEPVKVPSDAELLDLATLCGINHSVIDTDYCRAVELPEGTRHIADEVRPENTVAFARALLERYGKGTP